MSGSKRWWPYVGGAALTAVLVAVSAVGIAAAGSIGSVRDAHLYVKSLDGAVQGVQSAWSQAVYADSLAASGLADAAQGQFEQARQSLLGHAAVLSAAGIEEVDAATAALGAGFAALEGSFKGTVSLANAGGTALAAANHTGNTLAVSTSMTPVFVGLDAMSSVAHAEIVNGLKSGAATLRWVSIAGVSAGGVALIVLVLAAAIWSRRAASSQESTPASDERSRLRTAA